MSSTAITSKEALDMIGRTVYLANLVGLLLAIIGAILYRLVA
ncbi:MAG: hypothetical protein QOH97_1236 [Actinoplanes sp.]|jgi:hypothetical protein|nr:hypothetical protein [Actinoplanes sp.]